MAEEVGRVLDSSSESEKMRQRDADDYNRYIENIDVFLKYFSRLGMCIAIAGSGAALVFFSPTLFPPFPVLLKISGSVLFIFSAMLSILVAGDTYVRLSQHIPRIRPKRFLNHQWMERILLWSLLTFSLFTLIAASVVAHAILLK